MVSTENITVRETEVKKQGYPGIWSSVTIYETIPQAVPPAESPQAAEVVPNETIVDTAIIPNQAPGRN